MLGCLGTTFGRVIVRRTHASSSGQRVQFTLGSRFSPRPTPYHFARNIWGSVTKRRMNINSGSFSPHLDRRFRVIAFGVVTVFFIVTPSRRCLHFSQLTILFHFIVASPPTSYHTLSERIFRLGLRGVFSGQPFGTCHMVLFDL